MLNPAPWGVFILCDPYHDETRMVPKVSFPVMCSHANVAEMLCCSLEQAELCLGRCEGVSIGSVGHGVHLLRSIAVTKHGSQVLH